MYAKAVVLIYFVYFSSRMSGMAAQLSSTLPSTKVPRISSTPFLFFSMDTKTNIRRRMATNPLICTNGEVRLVGGCDSSEGRVEVCANDEWGTVCDDEWDDSDAQVVCNQLGFATMGAMAFDEAAFGRGSGKIWIDEAMCLGTEESLLECQANAIGDTDCNHNEDAGVRCLNGCTCGDVRLSGKESYFEGRVEVCLEGQWLALTLCDESWNDFAAEVVCSQLGFFSPGSVAFNSSFGIESRIYAEELECFGNESSLVVCSFILTGNECDNSFETAAVRCATSDVTFIPFGPEEGDNEVTITGGNITSLGSFILETPLVFYLQEEYQLHVTSNGVFSFKELDSTEPPSNVPHLATLWTQARDSQSYNALYSRVAQDGFTLGLVRNLLMDGTTMNMNMSSYQPSLAIIVTWMSNTLEIGQVVLSTDGRASFAMFIVNDGEGFRILNSDSFLSFNAGDQDRSFTLQRQESISLMTLRDTLNIFRIDGNCITNVSCDLDAYGIGCHEAAIRTCTCYPSAEFQNVSTNSSCVPGSVPLQTSCHPILLSCLISENYCPSDSDELNCTAETSNFLTFGEGVGDSIGSLGDDLNTGPFNLSVPIVYFSERQTLLYISTNGLVSFRGSLVGVNICTFPCTMQPVIAPQLIDFDFRTKGLIYYRISQEPHILDQATDMITNVNPGLNDYQPTLVVIVTWLQAAPRNSDVHETFQLVISTNGQVSFAALIFDDPSAILAYLASNRDRVRSGFDAGSGGAGSADFGMFLLDNGLTLESTNIFRIDGLCITGVLPSQVCGLKASSTACEHFTATNCTCEEGYEVQGLTCIEPGTLQLAQGEYIQHCMQLESQSTFNIHSPCCHWHRNRGGRGGRMQNCSDVNECDGNPCDLNSDCVNFNGSFSCTCKTGFSGNGFFCNGPGPNLFAPVFSSVVIVVLLVVVVVVVVVILLIKWRRRVKKKFYELELQSDLQRISTTESDGKGNNYFQQLRTMSVNSSFDFKACQSLLINSCNLQLGKTIGQGEFGIVYKALIKPSFNASYSETVAVKTLKGFVQKDLVTDLLKECAKMKEFNHPNVLALRGVCLDGGPAPYIVMPFMANGSLLDHLKKSRESLVIDPNTTTDPNDTVGVQKQLLDMCLQVGKGMEYLTSKRVIHRDLAARNCMIDLGFVIKVADFGLSESLDITKDYYRQLKDNYMKLPVKWLALECINDGIFTEKTDVWAYGVTCWEVFSGGKAPYPGLHPQEIARKLENGYRMEKPFNEACTNEMFSIVQSCWEEKAAHRPTFSELVITIGQLLWSMADYLPMSPSPKDKCQFSMPVDTQPTPSENDNEEAK